MTDVYEFSEYERQNLIYSFATMSPEQIDQAKTKLTAYEKEQAAKKAASAAAKPAAPKPAAAAVSAGAKPPGAPAPKPEPLPGDGSPKVPETKP
jgi:NADH-quinone oxidoreductase subunit I